MIVEREKIVLLYDLLEDFYCSFLEWNNGEEEDKIANYLTELEYFISKKHLQVSKEWNIKKVV